MAFRWSSESIVAEHKELQATAMALNHSGEFALLAGRRHIAIIDLDKPEVVVKRMTRSQQQKYNVSAAEWNPTSPLANCFVLASSEKAEIFVWHEGALSSEASLKAHTRTITDVNWHRSEPTILATCSIDTFLHVWDTRETRKPVISLSAIAGASQVKWNKLNPDYLASGHDCDIRVWDRRKSNQPVCYINAHLSKIHGLDWSPNHETQIVSSSNDSTVKFFDITNPRKSEIFIQTQNPVWRARYTPFGEALVTVVVPPLRRGENSLLLWSILDTSGPVHTFVGHSDIVLEFEWRYSDDSDSTQSEFQLVTWGRDNSLRIWKIDPHLLKVCGHSFDEDGLLNDGTSVESSDTETITGYENGDQRTGGKESGAEDIVQTISQNDSEVSLQKITSSVSSASDLTLLETDKKAPPKTLFLCESPQDILSQSPDTPGPPSLSQTPLAYELLGPHPLNPSYSLQQEFSSLTPAFDTSVVDIVSDADKRLCQVTVRHGNFVAVLGITIPAKYPNGSCPSFRFSNGTNIDNTTKTELLRVLKSTALQYTSIKKKKGCLEPCIRIFANQLKALLTEERANVLDIGIPGTPMHVNSYGGQQDYSIPFPRTSGARFSSSGYLVCFTRPTLFRQGTTREHATPRSLSALGAYVNSLFAQMPSTSTTSPKYNLLYPAVGQSPSSEKNNVSVYSFYYQDRMKPKRGKGDDDGRFLHQVGNVTIYDASKLMNVSKELASSYVLNEEDMLESCHKNMEAAALMGRKDLAQVWSLVSASLSMNQHLTSDEDFPWIHHPFGRKMILSLIDHYHSRFDVQTAALLACVLGTKTSTLNKNKNDPWKNKSNSSSSGCMHPTSNPRTRRHFSVLAKLENLNIVRSGKTGGSAYNTIHGVNTDGWEISTIVRHSRSNSEGSLTEAARPAVEHDIPAVVKDKRKVTQSLLDPLKADKYNEIRSAYSNILYRWDFLEQRAMVNKFVREYPSYPNGIEFHVDCSNCGHPCKDAQCNKCKKLAHSCFICHLPVRGSSNFCLVCGHGGHTQHYFDWFQEFEECPAGCGCRCLVEIENFFSRNQS